MAPILITGAARSGVPIIASIIQHCGAWGGIPNGEAYDGRRITENIDIKEMVMKPVFNGLDSDAAGQSPLPNTNMCKKISASIAASWHRRIVKIITSQGYKDGPWFYASPRICLVWPIWQAAFSDATWVLVRRNDKDIADACVKTRYMSEYGQDYYGWLKWLESYKHKFEEMAAAGINMKQIWPQRLINGKFNEIENLIAELSLAVHRDDLLDFISPILWKKGIFRIEVCDGI